MGCAVGSRAGRRLCLQIALLLLAARPVVSMEGPTGAAGETAAPKKVVIRFEPGSDHIVVPAVLNGTLGVKFLMDTGAQVSSIDSQTAKSLGIVISRLTPRVVITGVNARTEMPVVQIKKIAVGEAIVTNVQAVVNDTSPHGTVGLLGMNFLRFFKQEVDPGEGTLAITPKQVDLPEGGSGSGFQFDESQDRNARLADLDRSLYVKVRELGDSVTRILEYKGAINQKFRQAVGEDIKQRIQSVRDGYDSVLRDVSSGKTYAGPGGASRIAAERDAVVKRATQQSRQIVSIADRVMDEYLRQMLNSIMEAQSELFVKTAEIHEQYGDERGAWRLYGTGAGYGRGRWAREAKSRRDNVELRYGMLVKQMVRLAKSGGIEEAFAGLRCVADRFPRSRTAKEATRAIARLERDPKLGPKVLLARASRFLDEGKAKQAVEVYLKICSGFPRSFQARLAQDRIQKISAEDAEVAAMLETRAAKKAAGMLRMARNYQRAGVKEKAKEQAERVIAEFPGTSYAKLAMALLADLEQ